MIRGSRHDRADSIRDEMERADAPKHTPGPWSYDGHGINSIAQSNRGERIFKTCLAYDRNSPDRERAVADSNLVAAAPELLKAAQLLYACFDDLGNLREEHQDQLSVALEATELAIAKAEGR